MLVGCNITREETHCDTIIQANVTVHYYLESTETACAEKSKRDENRVECTATDFKTDCTTDPNTCKNICKIKECKVEDCKKVFPVTEQISVDCSCKKPIYSGPYCDETNNIHYYTKTLLIKKEGIEECEEVTAKVNETVISMTLVIANFIKY